MVFKMNAFEREVKCLLENGQTEKAIAAIKKELAWLEDNDAMQDFFNDFQWDDVQEWIDDAVADPEGREGTHYFVDLSTFEFTKVVFELRPVVEVTPL